MSFFRDYVYPHAVKLMGNPEPIKEIRGRIIPLARGKVLEIGVGSGANFPWYDPVRVEKLYALEPNVGMVRLAERQWRPPGLDVEFLTLPGEEIPLNDDSVDTVVSTFTLCTVLAPADVVRSIRRVLKQDGQFVFCELGLAPDSRTQRWQRFWEPVNRLMFAGLRLTRDIPCLVKDGGFSFVTLERGHFARFPKSWTHYWWGTATLSGS